MKKFLKLDLPEREVPARLDAEILAYAAMRANRRRRRTARKITLPAIAAGAAAALAIIAILPSARIPARDAGVRTAGMTMPANISGSELLALADTTVLEQESFNLAMGEFSFDSDFYTM